VRKKIGRPRGPEQASRGSAPERGAHVGPFAMLQQDESAQRDRHQDLHDEENCFQYCHCVRSGFAARLI
jgi:hypothetical protein